VEQPHRCGVPERVRGDSLLAQGGAGFGGDVDVLGDPVIEPVAGEAAASGGGERGLVGAAGSFREPDLEDRCGGRGQRRDPVLPPFPGAPDVRSGGELNVTASQAGELGGAQSGLDGEDEQGVVASAGPGAAVGSVQQRVDLVLVEECDDRAVGPLERDHEHASDVLSVFGVAVLGVAEQRMDRREPQVAGGDAVSVDIAGEQAFGPNPGRLIGVALDPDGGAVVVWIDGTNGALYQAVRDPGTPSFKTPVQIDAPHAFGVRMVEDSSGYALLSWSGNPSSNVADKVIASERAPGQPFGIPQVVATVPNVVTGVDVKPAITSTGDALVAWTEGGAKVCNVYGDGNDTNVGAKYATDHNGTWSLGTPFARSTWPNTSQISDVKSAGGQILIAFETKADHDAQCSPPTDGSSTLHVIPAASTATGIVPGTSVAIADPAPVPNSAQYYSPSFVAMAVNPSGAALVAYQEDGYPSSVKLLVRRTAAAAVAHPAEVDPEAHPAAVDPEAHPAAVDPETHPAAAGPAGAEPAAVGREARSFRSCLVI